MNGIGQGIGELIVCLLVVAVIAVPLAAWKLIELGLWAYQHVEIVIK